MTVQGGESLEENPGILVAGFKASQGLRQGRAAAAASGVEPLNLLPVPTKPLNRVWVLAWVEDLHPDPDPSATQPKTCGFSPPVTMPTYTTQPTRGVHKSAFSPSHLGSGLATAHQVGLMVNLVLLDTYSK